MAETKKTPTVAKNGLHVVKLANYRHGVYHPGETFGCDAAEAKALVDGGFATYAEKSDADEPAPEFEKPADPKPVDPKAQGKK